MSVFPSAALVLLLALPGLSAAQSPGRGAGASAQAGPGPGYYKIEFVHDRFPDPNNQLRITTQSGMVTWEALDPKTGSRVRREYPVSGVVDECVTAQRPWREVLAAICRTGLCGDGQPKLEQLGSEQWQLTVPLTDVGRSSPAGLTQMQKGMEQMLRLQGPGGAERAELAAMWAQAQASMPSAAQIQQEQMKLADSMEAQARTAPPQEARELREQARQIRSGQMGGSQVTGEMKQRWTRVADRCPR